VFAPTADQRFLAGSAEFLRTHFPVQLQSRYAGLPVTITEQSLLDQLLRPEPSVVGNRVFVLYGAAGSGKSELLRWLQTQISIQDIQRSALTIRISRTELDILHIIQRFQHMSGTHPFQAATLNRWEECRQKPRTLAKLLVLTALEQLLHSDDQINALYYQLVDIVQTNLERCFASMRQPEENIGQYIELFSREDLQELLRNSTIPVPIEYETLRHTMLRTFQDQLLEGIDLPYTLTQVAQYVQREKRQRPLLFIDDLVQSINLFATDLLDYFITLEEGCWDVVVGITPNSLEATKRGKELLDRINYLDTIDDRVEKLWLSDETGLTSSFLDEQNCSEFARLYLSEYKRQNRRPCNTSCRAFRRCCELDPDQSDELLAPFNEDVLVRLFRSLPPGKGKARYFTLYLRDILARIARGEALLDVIQQYIKSEQAVYHPDRAFARMYELYGPVSGMGTYIEKDTDATRLCRFFDIRLSAEQSLSLVVAPLYKQDLPSAHAPVSSPNHIPTIDPGKEATKSWLQGEVPNKQLLRNIRRGIVKAIKDGYPLDTLTRSYTAKPARVLRWAQTRLDTIPPVQLEGVDEFDGLPIARSIGPLAYILHDFADAAGWAEQNLRSQILSHEAFPTMLFLGGAYRNNVCAELEYQLGMKVEEFAFSLLVVAAALGRSPVELPLTAEQKIGSTRAFPPKYPRSLEAARPRLMNNQLGVIRRLFDDCFKLRENVYDGELLETMAGKIASHEAWKLLQSIEPVHLTADFRLNDAPLSTFVSGIQATLQSLVQLKVDRKAKESLISVCKVELTTDDIFRELAILVKFPGDPEQLITQFLNDCYPFELHQALVLASRVEDIQYEHSLSQLHQLLAELELGAPQEDCAPDPGSSPTDFTKAEVDALVQFMQRGFRMPVSQLEFNFIGKIAHRLPDLYTQLELRLQSD
jgi:hypothetical protein